MTWSILFTLHALVTFAAGAVLIAAPQLIPNVIGIELDASQYLVAYLLGAAEIAIAYLSFNTRNLREPETLRLVVGTIIVFHLTTVLVEFYALAQGTSAALWANILVRFVVAALFVYYGLKKKASGEEA